jgi:site-specific recombinase XerD
MSLFQAIERFMLYLKINKNSSDKTIEQYNFHLFAFLKFFHMDIAETLEKLEFRLMFLDIPTESKLLLEKKRQRDFSQKYLTTKISDINLDMINSFRLFLSKKNLSIKTVNAYMISIRSFLKYLKKNSYEVTDPTSIDLIKQEERKVEFLTHEEIPRIFEVVDASNIRGLRDLAIIECIYSTGLRVSELTALNRRDINLERLEFAVRGK